MSRQRLVFYAPEPDDPCTCGQPAITILGAEAVSLGELEFPLCATCCVALIKRLDAALQQTAIRRACLQHLRQERQGDQP